MMTSLLLFQRPLLCLYECLNLFLFYLQHLILVHMFSLKLYQELIYKKKGDGLLALIKSKDNSLKNFKIYYQIHRPDSTNRPGPFGQYRRELWLEVACSTTFQIIFSVQLFKWVNLYFFSFLFCLFFFLFFSLSFLFFQPGVLPYFACSFFGTLSCLRGSLRI